MMAGKKKRKGRGVVDSDENAVDVFGGAGASQEDLLAAALGTPSAEEAAAAADAAAAAVAASAAGVAAAAEAAAAASGADAGGVATKGKASKKKKKGRRGLAQAEDNAVDVFGGVGMSPEELLASALGDDPQPEPVPAPAAEVGGVAKDGGAATPSVTPVEAAPAVAESPVMKEEVKEVEPAAPVEEVLSEEEEDESEELRALADDETFEADPEVLEEFDAFSKEMATFTLAGRRKTAANQGNLKRAAASSGGEKYTSVRLEDIQLAFGNTQLLAGATWEVKTGDRVGLCGANGVGKSTMLKIISGEIIPDAGQVVRSSARTKTAFLRQEFVDELDMTRTLREEFGTAFTEENSLLAQYAEAEAAVAAAGEDLDALEGLLNRLEALRQECDRVNAWNLDARIDRLLPGLGFEEGDDDKLVAAFSGGWKVRIGLGKVLLRDPDLLCLDEPTNHLDLESVEWLESFLRENELPMVIVSHDREFLDRLCTKIVELEAGEAFEYPGNYSTFLKLKAQRRRAWQVAYERQQKYLAEQRNFIRRYRSSPARAKQVKSRQKLLERMERTGELVRPPPRFVKPLVFRFPPAPRSSRDVLLLEDVTHGYESKTLFRDVNLAIERGDRMAVLGANGSGKSTLLRLVVGMESPDEGTVQCQQLPNARLAYFEQNQADALNLELTVLETLQEAAPPGTRYEDLRALLGRFLFKDDSVYKKVSALSGGEKARLALAKIMLEPANILVFDEPSNHLDIEAKEMLEEALQHYDGTLLVVSHDRYFVSQVATQILAVENEDLVLYDGDYKSYMEKNQSLREQVEGRYIKGVTGIKSAPRVVMEEPPQVAHKKAKRKKNFGGSGVQSGKSKEMNAKRWNK